VSPSLEETLRIEGGRVLATLVRMTRDWDLAEDALQDALLVAVQKWAVDGVPDNPAAWLTTVARNKALDRIRREGHRRGRETEAVTMMLADESVGHHSDDTLRLMFTCCHPALSREAGVALTLRTIAGLSTVEIARAFLVPDATMGQRISRAKKKITLARIPYRIPDDHELPDRLAGVLAVLNVVFTVGHHAPVGRLDGRVDLADEVYVPGLLHELGLVSSAGEGRRMIDQGGVKLDGDALEPRIYNYARTHIEGRLLQVGKRRYARPIARS